MPRVPLVAGNWKMYKTVPEARDLATALVRSDLPAAVEVAVCPPFTALADVGRVLDGSAIRLGAQDVFWEPQGAYTGEISPPMLADLLFCVGERLGERDAGQTDRVVTRQVEIVIAVLPADQISRLVIAYEPIWAIGTGRAATDQEANRIIRLIRETLARKDAEAAVQTRLLYGGSVTPANASEFSRQPEIDGALVGGASLDAPKFLAIVRAHSRPHA